MIGGGTFSGYPLSMIAGLETLNLLKESQQNFSRINNEGNNLRNLLNQFFKEQKLPILAIGHKSMIMLHVLSHYIENPSFKEIGKYKDLEREALLQLALFNRNISGQHGLGALSMANTHEHMTQILDVFKEISHPVSNSPMK